MDTGDIYQILSSVNLTLNNNTETIALHFLKDIYILSPF